MQNNTNISFLSNEKRDNKISVRSIKDLTNKDLTNKDFRDVTTLLENDLDLRNMTEDDLNILSKKTFEINEFDGNGYSIKNKPEEFYFNPIFGII